MKPVFFQPVLSDFYIYPPRIQVNPTPKGYSIVQCYQYCSRSGAHWINYYLLIKNGEPKVNEIYGPRLVVRSPFINIRNFTARHYIRRLTPPEIKWPDSIDSVIDHIMALIEAVPHSKWLIEVSESGLRVWADMTDYFTVKAPARLIAEQGHLRIYSVDSKSLAKACLPPSFDAEKALIWKYAGGHTIFNHAITPLIMRPRGVLEPTEAWFTERRGSYYSVVLAVGYSLGLRIYSPDHGLKVIETHTRDYAELNGFLLVHRVPQSFDETD